MLFKETWFHHQIHKMQQYQTIHFIKLCLTLKNWRLRTVVLEKTRKSFGLQGEQTSQSKRKPTLNIHWKDWYWSWSSNTLATWWEKPTYWKRPWCWERLKAGGEGDDREWDGWMASPTQWTWVWVNSGSWWWTGRPGVLRVHGVAESATTEQLNWNVIWYPKMNTGTEKMAWMGNW